MPRPAPLVRRRSISLAVGAALLLTASVLDAHDFWLVPNAFAISLEDDLVVRGQTSSRFPTSESAVPPERIADARVIGAGGTTVLRDLTVHDRSLRLR